MKKDNRPECSDPKLTHDCSGCTDDRSEGTHQACTKQHGHIGCKLSTSDAWPTVQTRQIIDFEKKGNMVRFYLGENGKQWGDDWDDAPYEHNAGRVYDEFVKGHQDAIVPFEDQVFEPCEGHLNSQWAKIAMIQRLVPCIVTVADPNVSSFDEALAHPKAKKYYFGDLL